MADWQGPVHPPVGVIAAVAFGLFLAGLVHHDQRGHEQAACPEACRIQEIDAPSVPTVRAEPSARDREQNGERDGENQDARAAKSSATAAWVQAVFSGLGLVGLAATVGFANAAWLASRRAANAAEASNKLADDVHRRELRAYMLASEIRVEGFKPNSKPTFLFAPINYGQTPAHRVEQLSFVVRCLGDPEEKLVKFPEDRRINSRIVLGPGQPSRCAATPAVALTLREFDSFLAGKWTLIYCGVIRYRDIYGTKRWTLFRAYLRPSDLDLKGAGLMTASRWNNYST